MVTVPLLNKGSAYSGAAGSVTTASGPAKNIADRREIKNLRMRSPLESNTLETIFQMSPALFISPRAGARWKFIFPS
jgi:hypothetical protein